MANLKPISLLIFKGLLVALGVFVVVNVVDEFTGPDKIEEEKIGTEKVTEEKVEEVIEEKIEEEKVEVIIEEKEPVPIKDTPFGFDIFSLDDPEDTYDYCKFVESDDEFFHYKCTSAPKHHPDMKFFGIKFVENVGICNITGISYNIKDSLYGTKTKAETDKLADQIKLKYGKRVNKEDYFGVPYKTGLYIIDYDAPDEWLHSIEREQRVYSYSWELDKNPEVSKILVKAEAHNKEIGYVTIDFSTSLYDKCLKTIEESGSSFF